MIFPLPDIGDEPIYIYGTGLIALAYARQIKQEGKQHLLKGFIEDNSSEQEYLGYPIHSLAKIKEQNIENNNFLIASLKYEQQLIENLENIKHIKKNIIKPEKMIWNKTKLKKLIKDSERKKIYIYPELSSKSRLDLIYKKITRIFKITQQKIEITIPISNKLLIDTSSYPKIKIEYIDKTKIETNKNMETSDIIILTQSYSLKDIPRKQHDKIYFYGLYVTNRFLSKTKYFLAKKSLEKHQKNIVNLRSKDVIRVIFFVINKSTWKTESVFNKMLCDQKFEPIIFVCPRTNQDTDSMFKELKETYEHFKKKGYSTTSAWDTNKKNWILLSDISPDIIFFSNPHKITREEYYEDGYLNYLSCYVPYHHEIGSYNNNADQYGRPFHEAMWLIFSSCDASLDLFKKTSHRTNENTLVTGYPAMEQLLDKLGSKKHSYNWKNNSLKKIIWAPHHSIDMSSTLPYASFLEFYEFMKCLAIKYKNEITWCFKPHPILKQKLYNHLDWGKTKTDLYYNFWANSEFSKIELGEYIDLFCSSDAMIHDSGSFLAEYLYTKKPVLYTIAKNNDTKSYFSAFGKKAFNSCYKATEKNQIEKFVMSVAFNKEMPLKSEHYIFLDEVLPYFTSLKPSDLIIKKIKEKIT